MGIDFDVFAGLKTDDLKNQLALLREDLVGRQSAYAEKMMLLDSATNDFKKMEEKASFVVMQLEQMAVLTTPPPSSDAEIASDALDKYFTDPVFLASAGLGAAGGALLVVGGLGSPVLKLISKAPKMGKAATLAKSSKFTKILKLGKGAVALSAAIAVLELVVGMVSAQKINKQLEKDKATLNKHIKEADAEIKKLQSATKEATALVAKLLAEAELGHLEQRVAVETYVRMMNEAIAGLSARKAKVRMVRKIALRNIMEPQEIAEITDIDISVVESVARRVSVELALIDGVSAVEAARKHELESGQIQEIEKVVRARNSAVAGEDEEETAEILGIPVAVVREEGEETLPLLAPHWEDIEAEGDLARIGRKAVVSSDALSRLRGELRAKASLASGGDLAEVATSTDRPVEDVAEWGVEVAQARGQVAILKRDNAMGTPAGLAAQLRLPLALVG